ncbi:MAG: Crp/Fnr family transcriptional regulator, partial [Gammaproteobacteria bacterium]
TDVASRVMKLLLKLGKHYGKIVDYGVCLDIPLTHQEMADMIGTSRQTVTTVLGDLKRRGMIRIDQRAVIIRNGDWLQRGSKALDRTLDPLASA